MGADRDWVLRAETTELKDWEKFTLLCLDNGKVALETYHGRYVTAMNDEDDRDWVFRAETRTLLDWEKFTLVEPETEEELLCSEVFRLLEQGDVRIALKTYHGRYVTAMDATRDWVLRAETKTLSDWEKFTVVPPYPLAGTATPTPTLINTPTPKPPATPIPAVPLGTGEVWDVDINSQNSQEIYAVVRGQGIYKTTDGGYRWELINAFSNVESLTLGRAKPQTVFAAAERVVWRSTDEGANWRSIEIRNQRTGLALKGAVHVLAVAPNSDWIIYAGTDEGVYRSEDGGVTWELRNGGMGGIPIYALVVASGDGQLVYAAGNGAEIWRTIDGGNFWDLLLCPGEMGGIYTLALHPASDYEKNWLYIGADNSMVAVSVDGGRNWQLSRLGEEKPLYLRAPLKISAVTILDFRDSGTVLLAATGDRDNLSRNGIYKSTDGGLSWRPVNNGLPTDSSGTYSVHSIAVDPQNNQVVYAGTFVGLYKSTDGGESWARIP